MHKQLFGLKDQLGLLSYQLNEVAKLENEAPKATPGAPFPVVMSATTIGKCLARARSLLEEGVSILSEEIAFYETTDAKLAELQAKGEDETAKAEIVTTNQEVSAHEALTAGNAAFCMQLLPAAITLMAKGMEKARSYRA